MTPPLDFVTQQGASSSTWTAPSLQEAPLLPDLVAHHLEHSPDHVYARTSTGRTVKLREFLRAGHRAGRSINADLEGRSNRIVGILAESEVFLVSATVLGAICAGCIPLIISTRNSQAAIVDLCRKTGCYVLLVSRDSQPLKRLAEGAAKQLNKEAFQLDLLAMPAFESLYPRFADEDASEPFEPLPRPTKVALDSPCLILHSSGSTSFPKPITWSHRFAIQANSWPYYGSKDICGRSWFVGASPTFHMAGVSNHILVPLLTGAEVALFDPSIKAWPPTPELVLGAIKAIRPKDISVVPSFLEAWSSDPAVVEVLKSCERVIFGGAPLAQEVGDRLVEAGVNLANIYGSTEIGVTNQLPDAPTRDWAWLWTSPQIKLRLVPVEGDDTFVLQVLSSHLHQVAVSNIEGEQGFDTNDIVRRHPDDPELLCIVGRADSQIMLANGEKTNPEPLERVIEGNEFVQHSIIFGRGKLSCGLLVQPTSAGRSLAREELIDRIWPDVQRANAIAPQHSRLFRYLILVSDASRPFELTAKANVKRHAALEAYADDIEAAYQALERGSAVGTQDGDLGTAIERLVKKVLQVETIDRDANLFALGCDSLQAAYLHRNLSNLAKGHKLPTNVVYNAPSVAALVNHLEAIRRPSSNGINGTSDQDEHIAAMNAAIERFTSDFPPPSTHDTPPATKRTVVLTGTTGGLGSQLLAILLRSPDIQRVFAINRASKGSKLGERQNEAFRSRQLNEELLQSSKMTLAEGDLAATDLGLPAELVEEIREKASIFIHCAWRVNFKFPLAGFESDLQGLRNMINMALSCRALAHVVFTSSIAVLASWPADQYGPERVLEDASTAVGQGYGESKYVGERVRALITPIRATADNRAQMLQAASASTGLCTTAVRVGQLAGARVSGAWSTTEWFASLVKSAETLGCLPDGQDCVAWVPIDDAARCIFDMSVCSADAPSSLLNLVHPRPTSWSSLIATIAADLQVETVPYPSWVDRLSKYAEREGQAGLAANPAVLLLDIFKHSQVSPTPRSAQEALDMPRLETNKAERASETLRHLKPLREEDALRWLRHWQGVKYMSNRNHGK